MAQRDRAWRRRKTRNVNAKVEAFRTWFLEQFQKQGIKPDKEHKQHRHGALTHAQDLRTRWSTQEELREEDYREAA